MRPLHLAFALVLLAAPQTAVAQPHHEAPRVTDAARGAQQRPTTPTPGQVPLLGQPVPATSPTADEIAQRIQAFYDRTTDFQADFTQVSHNRLFNRDERRSGHVVFLRPGRMRWNYNQPSGDVIVSDGNTILAYQAEDHQALQQPLAGSQLPVALTFLAGTGRITDAFRFQLLDQDQNHLHFPNGYVLELTPIQPNPGFDRILFFVDRASYQVERTVVINTQGDMNRFDFNNPQVNLNPPQSLFRFTPPAGTNIVHP